MPADQLEKRATCTLFGFEYTCRGTTTTAAGTTPTPAPTGGATTAPAPSPTGGASTGGASEYRSGSTANDVSDRNGCTPLTVIFARGTSEGGNIGSVAGPPMFQELLSDLGTSGVSLQGVPYPANSAGNANCGAAGGSLMADLVKQALAACPNTRIALSGYSQGACVVHNAASQSGFPTSKVGAVVLFGDPFNGQGVGSVPASKVKEICGSSDGICSRGGSY
ncbi:hypothetical protein LTR37_013547 [Vermiconidia calcicola]|uniref:Uncharacterized protein n=1 Tax=Vermiconidia calcicola TaxID=1690605 RepID=A0ACC3MYU4_9PEZI|nr:hypothetical protein LTR37_013547 [Vermiconidia calcicola]